MTKPVLFYFWSERSQHCLQLTPVLESLAAQYNGQFILAKLDCDAEPMVASQFGLRAIPTVYLFQNGQPVDGFQGPQPEEAIRALLDKVLPREEELKAQEAMALMQEGKYDEALPLLKKRGSCRTRTARLVCCWRKRRLLCTARKTGSRAENRSRRRDQDTRYQGLVAQIDLLKQAADTLKFSSCSSRLRTTRRMPRWQASRRCSCIRWGVTKKRWTCCLAICKRPGRRRRTGAQDVPGDPGRARYR